MSHAPTAATSLYPVVSLPYLEAKASLGFVRVDRERVPRHAVAARTQAADAKPHHIAAHAGAAVERTSPPLNLGSSFSVKYSVTDPGELATVLTTAGLACSRRAWAWVAVEQPNMVSKSSASLRLRMSVPYSFRCRGWPEQRLAD